MAAPLSAALTRAEVASTERLLRRRFASEPDRAAVCEAIKQECRERFQRGDLVGALAMTLLMLEFYGVLDDADGLAMARINRGNIFLTQNLHAEALKEYLVADVVLRAHSNHRMYCYNLINISNLHVELGDFHRCIELTGPLLNDPLLHSDLYLRAVANLNLGVAYLKLNQLEQAQTHNSAAYQAALAGDDLSVQLSALDNLACLAEQRGGWAEALKMQRQILKSARVSQDAEIELTALSHVGRLSAQYLNPQLALEPLAMALEQAERAGRSKNIRDIHLAYSAAFRRLGQFELALHHFERYHACERELFNEDRERTVRGLTVQFELTRAQDETRLESQRRSDAEEARRIAEAQVQARTAELEAAQQDIVAKLALAAEFRDDTTGEHTWRVGMAAGLIAQELGLPAWEVEQLRVAARLHDVGKIGIPDSILLKPSQLTAQEFEEMRGHTLIGARLLSGGHSEVLAVAEVVALSHHERWDGSGYPHALRGEEIPLVGRIVAVADVLDALLQTRPYKRAWAQEEALAELVRQSGRQFDPKVVGAALNVFGPTQYTEVLADSDLISGRPVGAAPREVASPVENAQALRDWYEQLLHERTEQLEQARSAAERYAEQMRLRALTDSLTGLSNRRAFEDDLATQLARSQRQGTALTVLSLDLDDLKLTNDESGHASGDALLQAFGRALQDEWASAGQIYRIGGDEFAVILESDGPPTRAVLSAAMRRVLPRLREQGFAGAQFSYGCASAPGEAPSAGALLRLSDQRMYSMKRRHKRRADQRAALPPNLTLEAGAAQLPSVRA